MRLLNCAGDAGARKKSLELHLAVGLHVALGLVVMPRREGRRVLVEARLVADP